ncbi:Predicted PurR-regulated permease PerM [Hathewaya proteolytica DSM 3090]|uniref:Predicted PurR-regulated permease PerM n=2 Tax=Hathewaya proteolytica TaxID=29365 RepID=A0A1M6PU45_9CLOT|nr:Predicted PurR-regulated permease PerM [Hathewaya proteolytica DSM 3090]
MRILRPFIYGGVIAYLLIPVCNYIWRKSEQLTVKVIKSKEKRQRFNKSISIFLSILFGLAMVVTLLYLVIPQVYTSIMRILQDLPYNVNQLIEWVQGILQRNPTINGYVEKFGQSMNINFQDWLESTIIPNFKSLLSGFSIGVFGFVNFIKDAFVGIIVAIYILSNRTKFAAQAKKVLYSCFNLNKANAILEEMRFANKMFSGFVNGKILDSLIIGVICFVFMYFAKMPYAMLISVIVGVTNIIPFFGPFIGAIPSGLIILMVNPEKCLYFIIFILILQQFDGNILGPKILGDSIGVDSFWVLFSILLFGGIFGFTGMVLGVPTFAVIQDIIKKLINSSLRKKELSTTRDTYNNLDKIDEENKYHYFND